MKKYKLKINEKDVEVEVRDFSRDKATLIVNGKSLDVSVSSTVSDKSKPKASPAPVKANRPAASAPAAPAPSGGAGSIIAPIPGLIMEVYVKEGDAVTAGKTVLKMEAMKMENQIAATEAGTVQAVKVVAGDSVAQGETLVVIG